MKLRGKKPRMKEQGKSLLFDRLVDTEVGVFARTRGGQVSLNTFSLLINVTDPLSRYYVGEVTSASCL